MCFIFSLGEVRFFLWQHFILLPHQQCSKRFISLFCNAYLFWHLDSALVSLEDPNESFGDLFSIYFTRNSIIYPKFSCSLFPFCCFPVYLVRDFLLQPSPHAADFSAYLLCIMTYILIFDYFLLNVNCCTSSSGSTGTFGFFIIFSITLFFSPFLSYFLILLFSKVLTTGSLIPILGKLQIHRTPFSF